MRCKSYVHLKTKKVELDYQNEFKLGEYYTADIKRGKIDKWHIKVTISKLAV